MHMIGIIITDPFCSFVSISFLSGYIEFGDDLAGLGIHMKPATQVDANNTL